MNESKLVLRLKSLGAVLLVYTILFVPTRAADDDWVKKRCDEIQAGLTKFEARAREIREEIADREGTLEWLQLFQKHLEDPIIHYVPETRLLLAAALGNYLRLQREKGKPYLPDYMVTKLNELPDYVNRWARQLRQEIPRLKEERAAEQTEVGKQIFLLRDEMESLKCSSAGGDADPMRRISGEWEIVETDHIIRIEPEKNQGMLLETMENSFGFEEGDTVLSDFRAAGDGVQAKLSIRASKDDCPSLEPNTVTATIKVQGDGNTLTLTAPKSTYCTKPCRWQGEKGGTLTRTFRRIR